MTLAILCSGQGRQDRRMLDLVATAPEAGPILSEASRLLGGNLQDFLERASDAALHANRASQILCVARGLAAAACIAPTSTSLVAGYSVGEITAWGTAGFWSSEQTLRLAATRAELMDAAGGPNDGLGFVRGLPRTTIDDLATQFECAIAIINPNQLFVIGGERTQVEQCCAAAVERGAASARPIDVHVASHTKRLSQAVEPFLLAARNTPLSRPLAGRTLVGATKASVVRGVESLAGLAGQIDTMIDWAATLEALVERGVTRVIELGPGTALADMVRAAYPRLDVRAVDDFRTLAGVSAWVAE